MRPHEPLFIDVFQTEGEGCGKDVFATLNAYNRQAADVICNDKVSSYSLMSGKRAMKTTF